TNNIISIEENTNGVVLPNGNREKERWYQFKIPVENYDHKIGGIGDFRSIRFMRMFLSGWQDSVTMRFATLELGRNQWRTFNYSLTTPGENMPQQNQGLTDVTVTSVSLEENAQRSPVNYVIPPGVNRQQTATSQNQVVQLNEQSLSLKTCALQDGDARGIYKEVNVDMRQFSFLRMFIHAESQVGQTPVKNADVDAFMRIGSDFTSNYYEYRMPMTITQPAATAQGEIWPASNEMDITLQDLVNAKKERDAKGIPITQPYSVKDLKGNTIIVLGNPNIGGAKNIMLGVLNPKKTNQTAADDGLPKCTEIWFDEMRLAGINDQAGYAAAGKVSVQMADLGNVNVSGSMHTPGYGNIDQKIEQRLQDYYTQYNTSTNLSLGKLMPRNWGITLPLYVGYTQSVSNPKYDPNNGDVLVSDEMNIAKSAAAKDSIKNVTQDFTSITSLNLTNVRIQGNPSAPAKARMPWSIKNFDFSYSYNDQYKHNPTIESDHLITQKYGVGYAYGLKTKAIEPFKNSIRSKSKWLALIKDINLTPLPSTFTVRNELTHIYEETHVRNIDDGSGYKIPPTYYKLFTWTRLYTVRWEIMRSLSLDYSATNISRIDEPTGKINTKEKRDSVFDALKTFGHNTFYSQSFNSSYTVPLNKLPLTDWLGLRLGYSATYSWTGAAPVAYELGNTIGNTNTETVAGEMNMKQLYNKSKWLKAIDAPHRKKGSAGSKGNEISRPGGDSKKDEKDLRKKDGNSIDKAGAPGGSGTGGADDKNGAKSDTTKSKDKLKKAPVDEKEELKASFPTLDLSKMSDAQLDSLVEVQKELDRKKAAEEKAKKKKARKAARRLKRSRVPELSPAVEAIGRFVTMVNRIQVNYTQTSGTTLPGYMDSTRFMGINNYSQAPGYNFVYGYQPDNAWLARQAAANRLSKDSLFNGQFMQNYSRNLSGSASLVPIKDMRIELSMQQSFSKSHSELYADTGYYINNSLVFDHFNPYETGSFNISYVALHSMFNSTEVNSPIYKQFIANLPIISRRLGKSNPYTNGLVDPNDLNYQKGYTKFSQDVLIPSFIAAYSNKDAHSQALIDYTHKTISDNPFRYFTPLPNWKVDYIGLGKIPAFAKVFTSFKVSHGYTGSMSMNGFSSNLLFNDLYGLGFPSFIDPISGNYVPFFQVPNVTVSQAFNPLIGFDASLKNNLTGRFEVRQSKMESLSLIDYQI
ncbi:MAG: sprA, partial [Flavipsychrobacter sp.]|nr:sprA [Flavipsychrobacter sp.]